VLPALHQRLDWRKQSEIELVQITVHDLQQLAGMRIHVRFSELKFLNLELQLKDQLFQLPPAVSALNHLQVFPIDYENFQLIFIEVILDDGFVRGEDRAQLGDRQP